MINFEDNIFWLSRQAKMIYLFWGGGAGIISSFMTQNGSSIALTLILGFTGALGGGLAKLLVDYIAKKHDYKLRLNKLEKEHYEELKRKAEEELLLAKEEELLKQGR